jgi:diacylglycerol kinase (ATP)
MNGKRKVLLVINPASGTSSFQAKLGKAKAAMEDADCEFEVFYTKEGETGALSELINKTRNFSDLFVMGGDGTLNMVVNAMKNRMLPISILSNGTGNDSVKSLHGEQRFDRQLKIALHGRVKMFDLGVCNKRFFVNGVGIGFDGEVVKEMVSRGGKRGGHLDYLLTVLRIVGGFKEKSLKFTLDNRTFDERVLLLTISNGTTFGGGFMINPAASTDDGMLDVCLIRAIAPIRRFLHLPKLKTGTHGKLKETDFFTAKNISIEPTIALVAHLDGEFFGHPPFEISVLKQHLPVRVPDGTF